MQKGETVGGTARTYSKVRFFSHQNKWYKDKKILTSKNLKLTSNTSLITLSQTFSQIFTFSLPFNIFYAANSWWLATFADWLLGALLQVCKYVQTKVILYTKKAKASGMLLVFKSLRSDKKQWSYSRISVNNFFSKIRTLKYGRALMG